MGIRTGFIRLFKTVFAGGSSVLDYDEKETEEAVLNIHKKRDKLKKELEWLIQQNREWRFEVYFQHSYRTGEDIPKVGWGKWGKHGFYYGVWGKVFEEVMNSPQDFVLQNNGNLLCKRASHPKAYDIDYASLEKVKENIGIIEKAKGLLKKLYNLSILYQHLLKEEIEDAKRVYNDLLAEKQGRK